MSTESVDELINQLESLRIQEANILQRLIAARERESHATTRGIRSRETDTEIEPFSVGRRVQATNNIRGTFGRSVTINDKRAFITRVTLTRVYFRTVNGNNTWRSRTNLQIVEDNEDWNSPTTL
jgi:hypothetical protein